MVLYADNSILFGGRPSSTFPAEPVIKFAKVTREIDKDSGDVKEEIEVFVDRQER